MGCADSKPSDVEGGTAETEALSKPAEAEATESMPAAEVTAGVDGAPEKPAEMESQALIDKHLRDAATHGDVERIRELVTQKGANVESTGGLHNSTALHDAAYRGHAAAIHLLVTEFGANPDATNENGGTPLHWAAHSGQTEAMSALKECGAKLTAKNNQGYTPYQAANSSRESNAVKLLESWAQPSAAELEATESMPTVLETEALLSAAAEVTAGVDGAPEKPAEMESQALIDKHLRDAATHGDVERIRELVTQKGANVESRGGLHNSTALHDAAHMGHAVAIHLLVTEFGANPDALTEEGGTPLHWAANSGQTEAMSALKECGAKLTVKNNQDNTPYQAANSSRESNAVKLLESWGASA